MLSCSFVSVADVPLSFLFLIWFPFLLWFVAINCLFYFIYWYCVFIRLSGLNILPSQFLLYDGNFCRKLATITGWFYVHLAFFLNMYADWPLCTFFYVDLLLYLSFIPLMRFLSLSSWYIPILVSVFRFILLAWVAWKMLGQHFTGEGFWSAPAVEGQEQRSGAVLIAVQKLTTWSVFLLFFFLIIKAHLWSFMFVSLSHCHMSFFPW